MQANYIPGVADAALLDPGSSIWQQGDAKTIDLVGTPASLQPTAAIRANWQDGAFGAVSQVSLKALHNGDLLAFRLQWAEADPSRDNGNNTRFPDGAAIAFPLAGEPPLVTMGAPGQPINIWFWRADEEQGRQLVAEGLGSSETVDNNRVLTSHFWQGGQYSVVIARAMANDGDIPSVQFKTGENSRFGLAIWSGSKGERAGIKSFAPAWFDLTLAAG
jgi:DMSO reductase family type II enzyme heme b subunit